MLNRKLHDSFVVSVANLLENRVASYLRRQETHMINLPFWTICKFFCHKHNSVKVLRVYGGLNLLFCIMWCGHGKTICNNENLSHWVFGWLNMHQYTLNMIIVDIQILDVYYDMTVWILAESYIRFTITVGLIRLHMPGVKKSCA